MQPQNNNRTPTLLLTILVLLITTQETNATLQLLSNKNSISAIEGMDNFKNITYALSTFGSIPYGMNIIGFAHYNPENADGCKHVSISPYDKQDVTPFLIVKRGNCEFLTKAINANRAGAKVLIIIDNTSEELDFKPGAFGRGAEVHIPSMVIHKNTGEKLIEVLQNEDKDISQSVVFSFTNPLNKRTNVALDIVLSANNPNIYNFMSEFNQMGDSLGSNIEINLYFYTATCTGCEGDLLKKECFKGNYLYCQFERDNKGSDLIESQIIQHIFFQALYEKNDFFAFARDYKKNCLDKNTSQYKKCARKQMTGFGYNQVVFKLLKNKFLGRDSKDLGLLESQKEWLSSRSIQQSPLVLVNEKVIRGSLTPDNIFEAVCMGFDSPPTSCSYINGKFKWIKEVDDKLKKAIAERGDYKLFNIFIIVVIVLLAAYIFNCLFGRLFKKVMDDKIDDVVERTINAYKSVDDNNRMEMTAYEEE